MEKWEIAQNEEFYLFPQCFLCNLYLKGGYIDFSHLTKLKNLVHFISKKQYRSSIIKNCKITLNTNLFDGVPLKGYVAS